MRTCPRCGSAFDPGTVDQRYDRRCTREVAAIIAADALRRAPRFPQAKDLTGMTEIVL